MTTSTKEPCLHGLIRRTEITKHELPELTHVRSKSSQKDWQSVCVSIRSHTRSSIIAAASARFHIQSTLALRTPRYYGQNSDPGYRGLTGNESRYYGLSLIRTLNEVPSVPVITRVNCIQFIEQPMPGHSDPKNGNHMHSN